MKIPATYRELLKDSGVPRNSITDLFNAGWISPASALNAYDKLTRAGVPVSFAVQVRPDFHAYVAANVSEQEWGKPRHTDLGIKQVILMHRTFQVESSRALNERVKTSAKLVRNGIDLNTAINRAEIYIKFSNPERYGACGAFGLVRSTHSNEILFGYGRKIRKLQGILPDAEYQHAATDAHLLLATIAEAGRCRNVVDACLERGILVGSKEYAKVAKICEARCNCDIGETPDERIKRAIALVAGTGSEISAENVVASHLIDRDIHSIQVLELLSGAASVSQLKPSQWADALTLIAPIFAESHGEHYGSSIMGESIEETILAIQGRQEQAETSKDYVLLVKESIKHLEERLMARTRENIYGVAKEIWGIDKEQMRFVLKDLSAKGLLMEIRGSVELTVFAADKKKVKEAISALNSIKEAIAPSDGNEQETAEIFNIAARNIQERRACLSLLSVLADVAHTHGEEFHRGTVVYVAGEFGIDARAVWQVLDRLAASGDIWEKEREPIRITSKLIEDSHVMALLGTLGTIRSAVANAQTQNAQQVLQNQMVHAFRTLANASPASAVARR